jgi:hypothetical protein
MPNAARPGVRSGHFELVRELERIHPDHYQRIGKEIIRRYVDR